jgi:hypothetical protein
MRWTRGQRLTSFYCTDRLVIASTQQGAALDFMKAAGEGLAITRKESCSVKQSWRTKPSPVVR